MFSYIMKKIIGTQNEREINKLRSLVLHANEIEPELIRLSTSELRGKTDYFKESIKNQLNDHHKLDEGEYFKKMEEILWETLPEAFAVVREASRRTLGMRHFDVQIIGAFPGFFVMPLGLRQRLRV